MSSWTDICTVGPLPRPERRYRTYALDRRTLTALLVAGARLTVVEGVPEDAQLLGITWDEHEGRLLVSLYHPSFDPLTERTISATWHAGVRVERDPRTDVRGVVLRDLIDDGG